MPNKNPLELADIDIKVLDELELITDAYVSTFSKIGEAIKSFSLEINKDMQRFLSQKTSWRKYTSQCYDLAYKPFYYDSGKEFLIDELQFEFAVEGQLGLIKEINEGEKKKYVNKFNLRWGFYYGKELEPDKYFYFTIDRNTKRYNGTIMSLGEYKNLLQNETNFHYRQEHPEKGDLNEWLEITLDFNKKENLPSFFKFLKDELLSTFISKIKD